jgi:transcriptional regulator with XRE-family HTH domain
MVFQRIRIRPRAIGEICARRHLTQRALAQVAGVDFRYLSRLLHGAAAGTRVRKRMCERLGLKFDDLFEFIDNPVVIS